MPKFDVERKLIDVTRGPFCPNPSKHKEYIGGRYIYRIDGEEVSEETFKSEIQKIHPEIKY